MRKESEKILEITISPEKLIELLETSYLRSGFQNKVGPDLMGLRDVATRYICSSPLSKEQKSSILNRFEYLEGKLKDNPGKEADLAELQNIIALLKRKFHLVPEIN